MYISRLVQGENDNFDRPLLPPQDPPMFTMISSLMRQHYVTHMNYDSDNYDFCGV